jgi:hypothetical protein
MLNQETVQRTIVELRNAMSTLRSTPVNEINTNALELVMAHALVDLTIIADVAAELQQQVAELKADSEAMKDVAKPMQGE